MNTINLVFKKDMTKLAGNSLGKSTFEEQVRNVIDYNDDIKIVIPQQIDRIASSFIQGFFDEIVKNIGITGVEKKVHVDSSIQNLKSFILNNLE